MRVQLVAKPSSGPTGTARYSDSLGRALKEIGVEVDVTPPEPFPPGKAVRGGLRRMGLDTQAFFGSYPLRLRETGADVIHLTTQTMGTLLMAQRLRRPVVVTVLDIIPYLVRHDPELNTLRHPLDRLFYQLALRGLQRADALITISAWTKQTLVEALGIKAGKIRVIYPGVDHEVFRPQPVPEHFWSEHGLDPETRYVLYVGSDDPRKNMSTLLAAFAGAARQVKRMQLLWVGPAQFGRHGQALQAQIDALGIRGQVRRFSNVSDNTLALFYNIAAVCVIPSRYEGFGLPVVEALACGTPVVCSNAASLPEIADGKAVLTEPTQAGQFIIELVALLNDKEALCGRSHTRKAWAVRFDWNTTATQTAAAQTECLGNRRA